MSFDAKEFRRVLGAFVTGVTVVTTRDATGAPHGVTASSFSSVSLDPPLVLWSQSVAAGSYPVFRDAEMFAVNILAEDQAVLSDRFARAGTNKFEQVQMREGIGGLPLLEGCSAHLQCRKVAAYPGGDHTVFLGRVERLEKSDAKPLVFGGGRYLVARPGDLVTYPASAVLGRSGEAEAIRIVVPIAQRLARELAAHIAIATWGNHGPTIVRWEEFGADRPLDLRAGYVLPIFTTATGRVLVAHLPRELTQSFVDSEAQQAAHNQNADQSSLVRQLQVHLDDARRQGYAGLVKGPSGAGRPTAENSVVSVPILDRGGDALLALTAVSAGSASECGWHHRAASRLRADARLAMRIIGI